jgi:hypothetical protein
MSTFDTHAQATLAENQDLAAAARAAVLFTLPLYEMSRMRSATSARRDSAGHFAGGSPESTWRWAHQWVHTREPLGPRNREVVTPNNDTLYSSTWLDLAHGPLLLDVPPMPGRYFVLGLLDFYTNPFAYVGTRTTGNDGGVFLLHGPDWDGTVPDGVQAIASPTDSTWLIGRILVDGADDVAQVVELQDRLKLRPLPGSGARVPSLIDAGMQPSDRPGDTTLFVRVVNRALAECPPPAEAEDDLAYFAICGIGPGLDADALSHQQHDAIEKALAEALDELSGALPSALGGGWALPVAVSDSFGTRYRERAQVALNYIGALGIEEAMYIIADRDAADAPLDGRMQYLLHFLPDALPQTDAFWSITMYDKTTRMLVENPLQRYSIGDRTQGLRYDSDGGLRIAISAEEPVDPALRSNWLPAPSAGFYLALRLYVPRAPHLSLRFAYPPVERQ